MENTIILDRQGINTFLGKSSFSGVLAIYISYLAYSSKKGFSITSISKHNDINVISIDYLRAYIVAVHSVGLITMTSTDDGKINTISAFNSILAELIKDVVYSKAKKFDDSMQNSPETVLWSKKIETAELYFK